MRALGIWCGFKWVIIIPNRDTMFLRQTTDQLLAYWKMWNLCSSFWQNEIPTSWHWENTIYLWIIDKLYRHNQIKCVHFPMRLQMCIFHFVVGEKRDGERQGEREKRKVYVQCCVRTKNGYFMNECDISNNSNNRNMRLPLWNSFFSLRQTTFNKNKQLVNVWRNCRIKICWNWNAKKKHSKWWSQECL